MKQKILLTGGRPTGRMHIAHYIGAFQDFIERQDAFDSYFIFSDFHTLTTKTDKEDILTINKKLRNMFTALVGMGFDPKKTTFYLQSNIPELASLFVLIQNLISISRLEKSPSLFEMSRRDKISDISLGLLAYPVLEANDIIGLGANVIPVGRDNIDHVKITKEIVTTLNEKYDANLPVPEYVTGDDNYVVGLDGKEKMSKSFDNAIYIEDGNAAIREKIRTVRWTAYSSTEKNVIIEYLRIFGKSNKDSALLIEDFKKGMNVEKQARDMIIKELIALLEPMRERMGPYKRHPELIDEIVFKGTKVARVKVIETLKKVKKAMGFKPIIKNASF